MKKPIKRKHHRTIALCITHLLKQKREIDVEDIRQAYTVKLRRKPSTQAIHDAIKRLERKGKIIVLRYGKRALKLTSVLSSKPPYSSMVSLNLSSNQPKRPIHSAHHLKFTIPYEGQQPTKGAIVKSWGRYKKAFQSIYRNDQILGDKLTLQVFKKTIRVCTFKPPGIRTEEQIINAKAQSYIKVAKWAKEYGLKLGYFMEIIHSHHVLENKYINEFLKPLFEKYGKEINELLGSDICHSSHKDKIEHKGKTAKEQPNGREIKGHKVASGLEYLFLDIKDEVKGMRQEHIEAKGERKQFMNDLSIYSKQIKLHLKVLGQMGKTLKKMEKKL